MKNEIYILLILCIFFVSMFLIAGMGREDNKTTNVLEGYFNRCLDQGGEYHVRLTDDGLFEWCETY